MKKSFYMAGIIASALYIFSSCGSSATGEADHDHEHGVEHEEHGHGGSDEIVLEPETAKQFGVTTAEVVPGDFNEVLKVSGQITSSPDDRQTISSTSAGIVALPAGIAEGTQVRAGQVIASVSAKNMAGGDANASAKAALDAARRELDRLTPLHNEGIVSTRDYNAARAAYEQAKAAYSGSASGCVASSRIAGVISALLVKPGQYVEAGQPIAEVSSNNKLSLRADIPARHYQFLHSVKSANIKTVYSDSVISLSQLNGRLVSNGQSAGSQSGYTPIYFSFDNNGTLAGGSYVEVYLIGTQRDGVISVPVEAVTEQQGNYFVYVKIDDEGYSKRLVKLGGNDGRRVEILSGLNAGDQAVVTGAMAVKLAESSGAVPEGHSHNH